MARNNDMTATATVLEIMEPSTTALQGFRICITGHLGRTRTEIAKMIQAAGGRFEKSVTYGVTHLVTNEDWSAGSIKGKKVSSKYAKARQCGVSIISEARLYELMSSSPEEA